MTDDIVTEPVADEIVARLRQMATHVWADPLRRHYAGCEYWHIECAALTVCDEIERLRAAGDALVAVLRSGSDCGWDAAIDDWQEARRG